MPPRSPTCHVAVPQGGCSSAPVSESRVGPCLKLGQRLGRRCRQAALLHHRFQKRSLGWVTPDLPPKGGPGAGREDHPPPPGG